MLVLQINTPEFGKYHSLLFLFFFHYALSKEGMFICEESLETGLKNELRTMFQTY